MLTDDGFTASTPIDRLANGRYQSTTRLSIRQFHRQPPPDSVYIDGDEYLRDPARDDDDGLTLAYSTRPVEDSPDDEDEPLL